MRRSTARRFCGASTSKSGPARCMPSWGLMVRGKSTLASVLAGNEKFTVTEGSATFLGAGFAGYVHRGPARAGLFLGFQYPVEIPGVTMANFMKLAVNEQRKFRGQEAFCRLRVPQAHAREKRRGRAGRQAHLARRQRGVLGRRRRRRTRFSRWPCSIPSSPSSTRPIRGST